jgi:hypothetical protein
MQSTERAAVQVRLSGTELAWLDKWRRGQDKIPPRSEAIREAIRRLMDSSVVPASYDKNRDTT